MKMKVYKFGGASLAHADVVRKVADIIKTSGEEPLLVVVSAMGDTTNLLENVLIEYRSKKTLQLLDKLRQQHRSMISALFEQTGPVTEEVEALFRQTELNLSLSLSPDALYDQVISMGELISSVIIHHFLLTQGVASHWIDARQHIFTDEQYREGLVDWSRTTASIAELKPLLQSGLIITQGFIGQSPSGLTTTLGREGSDFSAAIFASCLQASSLTIWKDVPGVMSADPKRIPNATVFSELPYKEAAEMTYYGASVIHPKTIKPLANRRIPLLVKNFNDPSLPGTIIRDCEVPRLPPLIVYKENQCLVSCKVTDYSFVNEQQLTLIFQALTSVNIRINLMQNSAISFSFCIDFRENKISRLIQKLHENFEVYYNAGLTLITVKNYDRETFEQYRNLKGVMMEQSSRSTLQVLVKDPPNR